MPRHLSTSALRGCAAIAAALLAAGCERSAPGPPRDLVASADPFVFDEIHLEWSPASGHDRYELQGRMAGGAWLTVSSEIPADAVAVSLLLDPSVPEAVQLAFRLRALRGGTGSPWSNEAGLLRGIRAPSSFAAAMGTFGGTTRTGPVTLTWTNASQVATEILLERSPLDPSGQPGEWTPLAGALLQAGEHVDHLLEDGVAYAYRVRAGAGGLWSLPAEARTPSVDLAAPWGLRAVKVEGGVQLTWTNQSTTAVSAHVARYTRDPPWSDADATLTGVPAAWLDPIAAVWPVTRYQVTVSRPADFLYAATEPAQVEPFALAGPPALSASALRLPEAQWAVRDASGRFHLAAVYESPRIHRPTDSGYEHHLLEGATRLAEPGVLLDGAGFPHTVFIRGFPNGTQAVDVVHEWWNGSAWQSEVVVSDTLASGAGDADAWFGLGPGATVQVLYHRPEPWPAQESLVHVAHGGGGSTETLVTTPSVPDFWRSSATFRVAADGTAHVAQLGSPLLTVQQMIVLCTRTPAGAWSDEVVPAGTFETLGPWLFSGTAGNAALAYFVQPLLDYEAVVIRKLEGSWSAPEAAAVYPFNGYTPYLALSGSPDTARLALSVGAFTELHVRDGSGWQGVTLGPTAPQDGWLGFDAADRAWALFAHDSRTGDQPMPYSLFEQIP